MDGMHPRLARQPLELLLQLTGAGGLAYSGATTPKRNRAQRSAPRALPP